MSWGKRLFRLIGLALVSFSTVLIVWIVGYWIVFNSMPSLHLYALYALHPPGPMPINWLGAVWWLLLLVITAIFSLHSQGLSIRSKKNLHISALALIGFATYFLGRSHDNNIINLMPAMAILSCALLGAWANDRSASNLSIFLPVPILAMLPFFGFEAWSRPMPPEKNSWRSVMSYSHMGPPDLKEAIAYVRTQRNESFEVIDKGPVINTEVLGSSEVWTALHPLSNFPFVPSEHRKRFLRAGMEKIGKPGWLIVEQTRLDDPIIGDFRSVYQVDDNKQFGSFLAIRFVPPTSKSIVISNPKP
jgi:hypothetical protein